MTQHSFGFPCNSKTLRFTSYSDENQAKITQAKASQEAEVKIDHIIQAGPNAGKTVEHVINFSNSEISVGSKKYILKSFDFSEEEEKHYRDMLPQFFEYREDPTEDMDEFLSADAEGVSDDVERLLRVQSKEINFKMHKMMVFYNFLDKQGEFAGKPRYLVHDKNVDSLIYELVVFANKNYSFI